MGPLKPPHQVQVKNEEPRAALHLPAHLLKMEDYTVAGVQLRPLGKPCGTVHVSGGLKVQMSPRRNTPKSCHLHAGVALAGLPGCRGCFNL